MLTRPEASDPALEELKRRGRRRLVGAVVLILAAAVILPMLLESDPKPLGDDVSIQIPPIDSGKFVTPLSPDKGVAPKAVPDRAAPPPAATASPTVSPTQSPTASPTQPPTPSPTLAPGLATNPPVTPSPAASSDAKSTGAAPSRVADPLRAPSDPTPPAAVRAAGASGGASKAVIEARRPAPADVRPAPADALRAEKNPSAAGFVVQLAALADAKAAAALVSKLKSAGFPAHIETLKTPQGTMRRVRVGPYAAREAAEAQLVKLTTAGYRGVVTPR